MRDRISVIIPTFNRATVVCDCVRSVLDSDYCEFEVIVVDDCSVDDTQQRLRDNFSADHRVKIIRNKKNSQIGYSRNRGALAATGKYLCFIDDDNQVDRHMLSSLVAEFIRHPNDGVIAPLAINHRGTKEGKIWTLGCDFNRWTSKPCNYLANTPYATLVIDRDRYATIYSPNAFAVSKDDFIKVGGFDETITFYFDESDFAWRVMESGKKNWIIPSALTHHYNALGSLDCVALRELGINTPWKAYYLGRNRFKFVWRHFAWYQALVVTLVFMPLLFAYYTSMAVYHRRIDVAWAYVKGVVMGFFNFKVTNSSLANG